MGEVLRSHLTGSSPCNLLSLEIDPGGYSCDLETPADESALLFLGIHEIDGIAWIFLEKTVVHKAEKPQSPIAIAIAAVEASRCAEGGVGEIAALYMDVGLLVENTARPVEGRYEAI